MLGRNPVILPPTEISTVLGRRIDPRLVQWPLKTQSGREVREPPSSFRESMTSRLEDLRLLREQWRRSSLARVDRAIAKFDLDVKAAHGSF